MNIQDLKNRATILDNQQAKQIKGGNVQPSQPTQQLIIVEELEV